ncbi:protein commissureless 2 homolog [Topomyia yanbarensis]|uniref:protein commissureless 2 homolog n=1 Tax=Topomyia yanbarensis TaxID=2498891 RepID=UPI00273AE0A1|nr:protein commissureless 2 homolog [Topomyia yanbarensis]
MIDNLESKITFEIPTHLDFDKLIRGNNYSVFWPSLHYHQDAAVRVAGMGSLGSAGESLFGDYNTSDFNLLSSLQSYASRSGPARLGDGSEQLLDPTYERFIGDVWVGIVLTLMILSSIFCMCSCFLYHKFRQWQRSVLTARSQTLSTVDVETPPPYDVESLPSYTIVSGLPSYNDAIEQLKQKQQQKCADYGPVKVHRPSVIKLFESQSQDLMGGAKLEEIRYNFANSRSTSLLVGAESFAEATPTTSTSSNQMTAVVVPNFKGQIMTGGGDDVSPMGLKKFNVCRYTIENDRSSGMGS